MKRSEPTYTLALAGNPNVGKSTVFNALTGLHQHTGNWPGKTVASAEGVWRLGDTLCRLVDTPGTYSLLAHSAEEEVARDFLCFDNPDGVVVVCDATCLVRNLNLVLQILETGRRVVVCVNLMDEAARKGIHIDLDRLSRRLGVPVVAATARKRGELAALKEAVASLLTAPTDTPTTPVQYPLPVETAVSRLQPAVEEALGKRPDSRWITLRLLEGDSSLLQTLEERLTLPSTLTVAAEREHDRLAAVGFSAAALTDALVEAVINTANRLGRGVIIQHQTPAATRDDRVDRVLTGRRWGYPLMVLLLLWVLWLTVVGANAPSELLATGLFWIQEQLTALFAAIGAPDWLHGAVVLGAYRTLAWVVAVMLPPMAIFFPLFTLLEDVGYLPRIAYNLDTPFSRCRACGKQALTMCMGLGCNAVGVTGARIIDSPRERLLAVLTNSFMPCNGRFPTLITLISLFLIGAGGSALATAGVLTGVILLAIGATLLVTRLLAGTLLHGKPSAFTLELPPYRPPQVGRVLVRSVLDRTLFVLGRAAAVAAPAGLLIWILANTVMGGQSLLHHTADFLDPVGRLMGLDGVILLAFMLGLPANEIVLPLMLMLYAAGGTLPDTSGTAQIFAILTENGWTWHTALCTVLFYLFHWPCSTTLLTVRKETGSWTWTALAAALPTALGFAVCITLTGLARLCGG